MPKNTAVAEKTVADLTRAVNRRKQAISKVKNGRDALVSERQMRKLLKQAQRRAKKAEINLGRINGIKPSKKSSD